MARRVAISFCREVPRAINSPAMFAHASSRIVLTTAIRTISG